MKKVFDLLIVHICLLAWMAVVIGHLKGNFGERSYRARIKWFRHFFGPQFDEKTFYVNWLKRFYGWTAPIGIAIYILMLYILVIKI